jgi:putative membrane protein
MSSTRRVQRSVTRTTTLAGVAAGVVGLVLAGPIGAAAAASDDGTPEVINRETVQAKLNSDGEVEKARLYSQLTVLGEGKVNVLDPTSSKGLRDLDGFSAPLVRDGKAQYSIDVDGREDRRTVADFTGEMPVTLKAAYTLDGKKVKPQDVVGKSGTLEATYTVVNRTAEPTEITYKDGKGQDITETMDLVTPYVGTLQVVVPGKFADVVAPFADVAGDGRGGTAAKWTLVLFDPLGAPAQQLTWTAQVTDAELPPATLQVVPVAPNGNQVLSNSEISISEGATAAAALTAGAYKIDGKVLELRDGARQILDGLSQLSDGADALNAGLAGSAAPGARTLADGIGSAEEGGAKIADGNEALAQGLRSTTGKADLAGGAAQLAAGLSSARSGSGQLAAGLESASAGAQKVAAGNTDLAAGAVKAADGAESLSSGLVLISAGLDQLSGAAALPAAQSGAVQLRAAVDQLLAGLGSASTDGTILNGVVRVSAGLTDLQNGLGTAKGGVDQVKGGIDDGLAAGGGLDQLAGAIAAAKGQVTALEAECATATDPVACGTAAATAKAYLDAAINGVNGTGGLRERSTLASGGLGQVSGGLASAIAGIGADPTDGTLLNGLARVQGGLNRVVAGLKSGNPAAPGVAEGLDGLVSGLSAAVAGVTQLATGAGAAATGSQALATGNAALAAGATKLSTEGTVPLSSGLMQLSTGGQKLDDGIGQLAVGSGTLAGKVGDAADGARKLADGSDDLSIGLRKLYDGGNKLADGLGDAADGSGKIADGLVKVEDGQTKLANGANQLSGEGTNLLAGSANNAAKANAKKAAMLQAMGGKAEDGALPYGLPDGASGTAAYSMVLAGATSATQDNTTRGAVAVALLGLGSAAGLLARRRFVA